MTLLSWPRPRSSQSHSIGGTTKNGAINYRSNAKAARNVWGELSRVTLGSLRELTVKFSLSVGSGDLQLLNGRWYTTAFGGAVSENCTASA
jgi:hypothetical protein